MSEYVLLLRGGNESYPDFSPEQREAALQRYRDWSQKLHSKNQLVTAVKLDDTGKRLVKKTGTIQVDGPFTETKETIGGYFTIIAATMDAAIQIAQECPIFDEGGTIEIREIQS